MKRFQGIIISDIRFWIAIFFIIRLYGITQPPLEVGHNWRQTSVTMPARNFLEVDNNILYPRVDFAGNKTGITGMEFPLLNYLIYLTSEILDYQHWYGRLINLSISSLGLWFFFKLIEKYFTKEIAFNATIILGVSIWFQFFRKIMPDTFAMSLLLAGFYYGTNYLDNDSKKSSTSHLLLSLVLISLATLSKISSGYFLILFILYFLKSDILLKRKVYFSIFLFMSLLPTLVWYFYWSPYLISYYEFEHYFMGTSFSKGAQEIFQQFPQTLKRFYDTALKYIGFLVFILGMYFSIIQKNKKIAWILILSLFAFSILILKVGGKFPHHDYYVIPFVPVMALIASYGLTNLKSKKIALILLIAISIEGIANQSADFRIRTNEKFLTELENDLDAVSKRADLILINSGYYPTPMYFAHRKGWIDWNFNIQHPEFVNARIQEGLKYILILKRSFGEDLKLPYPEIINNADYRLYKVSD
jgi:hypothetical protein